MALNISSRPQGYILDTTANTATFLGDTGNPSLPLFTKVGHGLVDGDIIYVFAGYETVAGAYWYVDAQTVDTFYLLYLDPFSFLRFGAASITGTIYYYKKVATHNWSSVHLPIVYRLLSTLWPINGVDTARTITTFSNYNGYTYINAVGDIKTTGTASSLESVVLSGTSVDGVYKIINWFSDTNFVINLPYSAANVLSTGTVQYYYLNYHARIRIYAGISGTIISALRPAELIAEIRCIPDSSGYITVNIADYVKQKIEVIKNNINPDAAPQDIDSWTNFYITFAESYDDSNMYTVSELVGSYTDDSGTFVGYAANAKLQFQTRSSGFMSEYVPGLTAATVQKFLTTFTRPTIFAGKYFDISYIKNAATAHFVKKDLYSKDSTGNYSLISSSLISVSNYQQGIYRYVVAQSASLESRIDLTLYSSTMVQLSEVKTIDVSPSADCHDTAALYMTWKNYLGGQDYWSFTAQKLYSIDILESKTQEDNIYSSWPKSYGEFGASINKQTTRRSRNVVKVNSQYLTKAQVDSIALIKTSPLVQILTTNTISGSTIPTLRTVIVDTSTLKKYQDREHLHSISFNIEYTDEIAVQEL